MPKIEFSINVAAPLERCFDLSRSIDLHVATQSEHAERAIAGVTSGLIGLNETVTWEARHFGVTQRLTSIISIFERPHHFRDEMVRGAFRTFTHDHFFKATDEGTVMREAFEFESPFGPLGMLANSVILTRYMTKLLRERSEVIRGAAESDEWRKYVPV